MREAGYVVSIICPKGRGYESARESIDEIEIYRHPMPPEASGALGYVLEYAVALFWEFLLTWRVFWGRGFDAIHACNPPDTIFLIGAFFKLFGKRFLFDHHDINPELYEAKFGRKDVFYRALRLLERCTFRTAGVVIATNESYRLIAIERGKMAADKVYVVRSGPDLRRLQVLPPVPALKRRRQFLIGYVGVMGKQEGIDSLLRSARILTKEMGKDVQFGLVGGGTELEEMRQYADELGIAEHVTFTGRVSDQEMLEMLNTADVCVNSDVANEMNDKSTMNKIMEYMALGKPIVQFDLTEGKFSAQDASLYAAKNDEVDFARKIAILLDDPELRHRMGRFGRTRVEGVLEWRYEVPKLLAAYDKLFSA